MHIFVSYILTLELCVFAAHYLYYYTFHFPVISKTSVVVVQNVEVEVTLLQQI